MGVTPCLWARYPPAPAVPAAGTRGHTPHMLGTWRGSVGEGETRSVGRVRAVRAPTHQQLQTKLPSSLCLRTCLESQPFVYRLKLSSTLHGSSLTMQISTSPLPCIGRGLGSKDNVANGVGQAAACPPPSAASVQYSSRGKQRRLPGLAVADPTPC